MISIDFKNGLLEEPSLFFVPQLIKPYVARELRKAGFECETLYWRNIDEAEHADEILRARMMFEDAGYDGVLERMGAILSRVHPDDLFELSKKFFGPTIDPDFKRSIDEMEANLLKTYEECYSDLDGIIQIHAKSADPKPEG